MRLFMPDHHSRLAALSDGFASNGGYAGRGRAFVPIQNGKTANSHSQPTQKGSRGYDNRYPPTRFKGRTIQRAYREMEQMGLIQTLPGKGCFVCGSAEPDWQKLDSAVAALLAQGVTLEDILKRIGGNDHA